MTLIAAVNETALVVFALVVGVTHGDHLLRLQARHVRHRLLGRRPRPDRPPERLRDRGRLHVGGVVPRNRRPDLPVRLRRLPVLGRLPRRVPDRAVPARRAHAQLGQVHDRRRAGVPAEAPAGPRGRRARNAVGGRLLPDRADGRRGRPDRGARGHRLLAVGRAHRRVHDHLHRGRRHARHELGADHQGVPADGGGGRDVASGCSREIGWNPIDLFRDARAESPRAPRTSSRGCASPSRSTPCRSASGWCSAPPGCRTS